MAENLTPSSFNPSSLRLHPWRDALCLSPWAPGRVHHSSGSPLFRHGQLQPALHLPWCPEIPADHPPSPKQRQLAPPPLAAQPLGETPLFLQRIPDALPCSSSLPHKTAAAASSLSSMASSLPRCAGALLPPKDSAPISLSRQRSAPQPSFPCSPTKSTRRRCSTKCAASRVLPARCSVKHSGQHAVDTRRLYAVFGAAPLATSSTPGETSRCPCCYPIYIYILFCLLGRMLNCCVCLITASRQCQPSCTRVRYKAGRVNHMHAQLRSDLVQVD
jgi:hypothetical protein